MRTPFATLAGVAVLTTGLGFAAASAWSAERPASPEQRAAAARPNSGAISMIVYKSAT